MSMDQKIINNLNIIKSEIESKKKKVNIVAVSKTLVLQNGLANATNSDTACFKSMVIGSTTFNRADASFNTSSSVTSFSWSFAATNDGYADITSTQAPYPAPNTTYTGSLRRRV